MLSVTIWGSTSRVLTRYPFLGLPTHMMPDFGHHVRVPIVPPAVSWSVQESNFQLFKYKLKPMYVICDNAGRYVQECGSDCVLWTEVKAFAKTWESITEAINTENLILETFQIEVSVLYS